ncbi:MAG: hypothetical protein XD98_0238 [Microgenomates bacterium 39_6]|nr:MAG: hypothetical protein XD98_0238 [Microgenomates bacterium 39_6]
MKINKTKKIFFNLTKAHYNRLIIKVNRQRQPKRHFYSFCYSRIIIKPDGPTITEEKACPLIDFKICDQLKCYQQIENSDIKQTEENRPPGIFYLVEN